MPKTIRVGIRPSRLAFKQAIEVKEKLPQIAFEVVSIETEGDRDKTTPLFGFEERDFFTRDIEEALLEGRIDAAIHSAKDLERDIPEGLVIACMTRSISPFECLVSKHNLKLSQLPEGAIVGTSSRKRQDAILRFRKGLKVKEIRGNIDERLEQLDGDGYDAIVVAHAALLRLGYEERIAEVIPAKVIGPHPLQGKLAVQVKGGHKDIIDIFRGIDNA